jgi:hypothetical protein
MCPVYGALLVGLLLYHASHMEFNFEYEIFPSLAMISLT